MCLEIYLQNSVESNFIGEDGEEIVSSDEESIDGSEPASNSSQISVFMALFF